MNDDFSTRFDQAVRFAVISTILMFIGLFGYETWAYQNKKRPYYDCVNLKTQKRFNLLDEGQYQRIILRDLNTEHTCSKHMYTKEYVDFLNKKH